MPCQRQGDVQERYVVALLSEPEKEKKKDSRDTENRLKPIYSFFFQVRDLMSECWQREERERPSFREIHLFLQRKNLGYDPNNTDQENNGNG